MKTKFKTLLLGVVLGIGATLSVGALSDVMVVNVAGELDRRAGQYAIYSYWFDFPESQGVQYYFRGFAEANAQAAELVRRASATGSIAPDVKP